MEATTAINGHEAFEILCNQDFDLVVLDLQMPISDGYETCKNIKKRYNSQSIFHFDSKHSHSPKHSDVDQNLSHFSNI